MEKEVCEAGRKKSILGERRNQLLATSLSTSFLAGLEEELLKPKSSDLQEFVMELRRQDK